VLRLVESGFGISLLPQYVQHSYNLDLSYIPLKEDSETIPVVMLTRKENPNPALLNLKFHLKSSNTK
jgi:DNA-binding transcriptional LysR family regulator